MIPVFLCWGSFLNVLAYRLIRQQSIVTPGSHCTHCKHALAWYDNIPVLSWFVLRGACRHCSSSISFLYPFIELLTAVLLCALFVHVPIIFFPAYFVFFSALIVTIRSDLETMLISRYVTLFLIPVGLLLSKLGLLPITLIESIIGTILGYFILSSSSKIFTRLTGKEGIGQGDIDLLSFIGAFTGVAGCWVSLLLGSVIGSALGITYLIITKSNKNARIPFGPFLASGAIGYVLFQNSLLHFIFGI